MQYIIDELYFLIKEYKNKIKKVDYDAMKKQLDKLSKIADIYDDKYHGLEEAGKVMELLRDLGILIDKAKLNK